MTILSDHSIPPTDNPINSTISKDNTNNSIPPTDNPNNTIFTNLSPYISPDEKDFDPENTPSKLLRTKSTISLGKCPTTDSPSEDNGVLDSKVSKLSFSIYLLCAFCTVGSFPFVAFNLLSVLLLKFPGILVEKHKFYLSLFVAIDQIISILTSALWGYLSERIGRKRCFSMGLAVMGISIGLFPLATCLLPSRMINFFTSVLFLRLVFGVGAACSGVMFSTVLTDYCKNNRKSRGQLAAMAGLSAGLGATVSVTGLNIVGVKGHQYLMCFIMCGIVLVASALCLVFMRDTQRRKDRRLGFCKSLALGITKLKTPEVLVACLSVYLCRGNNLLPLTFTASRHLKSLYSVLSLVGMCIFGYFVRKFDCYRLMMASVLGVVCGFGGMQFFSKPVVGGLAAAIAGIGQGGLTVTGMALLSGAVGTEERSALSSTFNLFGNCGILMAAVLGLIFKESSKWYSLGISIPIVLHLVYFCVVLCLSLKKYQRSFLLDQPQ